MTEAVYADLARRPAPRSASVAMAVHPGLGSADNASLQAGHWLGQLSLPLRQAILNQARVREVAAGTMLSLRGQCGARWVGVVRGALRLGTPLRDGRSFTLDFIAPGQWYGDIAGVDRGANALDLVAQVPSLLVEVAHADLQCLIEGHAELREALLLLNCGRLRYLGRRFEEMHTLTLPQRLARELQRLAQRFGRPVGDGVRIDLAISQSDLAALVGGSRQRVNRALGQMQALQILRLGPTRPVLLDDERLAAVADGRIVLSAATGD